MSRPQHQLVIGSGPVGSGVALRLAEQGTPVTVATRRGIGPAHPLITLATADAADADAIAALATGASAIYNAVNPPYHKWATLWPPMHAAMMTAAQRTGAVLVMMDNLYAFGADTTMPMAEHTAMRASGTKGAMRATMARELLEAHARGTLRATLARASDFFGPTVIGSAFGDRVVPRVTAGKKVSVLGRLDVPHSVSYMPDVVTTLVTIAGDERAWGSPWHVPNAPAASQREIVDAFATAAGTQARVAAIPKAALSTLGVFMPVMRELKETWYQFARPFITDSALTEETFSLSPTPMAEAAEATVTWWKTHPRAN